MGRGRRSGGFAGLRPPIALAAMVIIVIPAGGDCHASTLAAITVAIIGRSVNRKRRRIRRTHGKETGRSHSNLHRKLGIGASACAGPTPGVSNRGAAHRGNAQNICSTFRMAVRFQKNENH